MTRNERAKIGFEIRKILKRRADADERMTVSAIYEEMLEQMPDLMEQEREQLLRAAMSDRIRHVMKETLRQDDETVSGPALSPELERIQVPRCISLPGQSDAREMIWVPTLRATPNELTQHIKYLRKSAKADFEKAKKLQTFHDELLKVVNPDDLDVPICVLLGQARAA